jgi:hypothetical protein
LRKLAKHTLGLDSQAKVQMRQKVRGLRGIERAVLQARRVCAEAVTSQADTPQAAGATVGEMAAPRRRTAAGAAGARAAEAGAAAQPAVFDPAGAVVLDYCGCVRGILNDDQGGPLQPPGLRMAEALAQVRESLGRVLALCKPGPAHGQLARLAGCIDEGLAVSQKEREQIQAQVEVIAAVAGALAAEAGSLGRRRASYRRLLRGYQGQGGEFYGRLAKVMKGWQAGLFVAVRGKGAAEAPWDNLELERWFRLPKGHERRIHGRRHAGVRIVQEGPTLLLALDAHRGHPEPFCAEDLLPYRDAQEPADQTQAIQRRKIMRKARSPKNDRSSSPS